MADQLVTLLRWLAAQDRGQILILSCKCATDAFPRRSNIHVIWDGCLDDLSGGTFAQILAVGVSQIQLNLCKNNHDKLAACVAAWKSLKLGLISSYQVPSRRWLSFGETVDLANMPVPRRVLLGLTIDCELDLQADYQDRTLCAIKILGFENFAESVIEQPQVAGLEATDCVMCGVCVQGCPHHALELSVDTQGEASLTHILPKCRDCRRCIQLCPSSALSATGEISWANMIKSSQVVLAQLHVKKCARCGVRIDFSGDSICSLCRYKEENPFGSIPVEIIQNRGTKASG